ncbi:MAG: hypothetical protein K1W41_05355 [Lachnospiraceae bacterium]
MSKLYYTTESGRYLIKEALLSNDTLWGFYDLFGENEIANIVLEKAGEYPWDGKFSVDSF